MRDPDEPRGLHAKSAVAAAKRRGAGATIVTKTSQCVTEKRTIAVRFVPMVDRAR